MSSSPDDLALKLEWFAIRDFLFGQNYKKQDVKRALEMAITCRHTDAQWLTRLCAGKDVKTMEEAKAVFLAQGNDDAQALCFAALVDEENVDEPRLRRSAEMGFALAQARMCFYTEGLEHFTFASRAAAQGERDGFYCLGISFKVAAGRGRDVEKAKENFFLAARMDCVLAMAYYGASLDETDPQRWHWWGLAAARGVAGNFLHNFPNFVNRFQSDPSLAPAVFMIGRALRGQIDAKKREIFGQNYEFKSNIGPANRAIGFFTAQCAAARKAVDAWCLIARRVDGLINRDVRKKIGTLIWAARERADYAVAERKEAAGYCRLQ